jgi:hypothetical protein
MGNGMVVHGVLLGDAAFVSSNGRLQVVLLVCPAAGAERPAILFDFWMHPETVSDPRLAF